MRNSFVTCAVVCLLFCAAAMAQDPYPTAKVKVITVPACAFQFADKDADYSNVGVILYLKSGGARYTRAPLTLPNKTVVLKMELICKDNSATKNIPVWLHRVSNDQTESQAVGKVESDGASSSWRTFMTSSFTDNVIDNVNYCYFLNIYLSGLNTDGIEFSHVKIYYKGKW